MICQQYITKVKATSEPLGLSPHWDAVSLIHQGQSSIIGSCPFCCLHYPTDYSHFSELASLGLTQSFPISQIYDLGQLSGCFLTLK